MLHTQCFPLIRRLIAPAIIAIVIGVVGPTLSAHARNIASSETDLVYQSKRWIELDGNNKHRFIFTYHYDRFENEPSEVIIILNSRVPNAFDFEVIRADTMITVGNGTQLSKLTNQRRDDAKLVWAGGRATETIDFYVVVTNVDSFIHEYSLHIKGDDVSSPSASWKHGLTDSSRGPAVENGLGEEANNSYLALSRSAIRRSVKTDNSFPGSSPETALSIANKWQTIESESVTWFSFAYDVDQHAVEANPITIQLETEIVDALQFEVTTSRMKTFGLGQRKDTFTHYAGDDSLYIWTSESLISGRYFVRVANKLAVPVRYNLSAK